jgi:MoxR-like ATPase
LSAAEEAKVVKDTTSNHEYKLRPVLSAAQLRTCQTLVRNVPVGDSVIEYAVAIAAATRPTEDNPHDFVKKWVTWGAGPRGSQQIILAAKARALLRGQYHVTPEDVRAMAVPALRHRVITNYFAESEGTDADKIIRAIIKKTPEPKSGIR